MYRLIILTALVSAVLGQLPNNRTCSASNLSGIQVNIQQLIGTWYQIERIENPDELGHCSTSTFSNTSTSVTVLNREVYQKAERTRTGVVTRNNSDLTGKFVVTFGSDSYGYYALVSDYTSYALLLACKDTSNTTSNLWAWKLSRTNRMSAQDNQTINNHINQNPLLMGRMFMVTEHSADACNGSSNLIVPPIMAFVAYLLISRINKL